MFPKADIENSFKFRKIRSSTPPLISSLKHTVRLLPHVAAHISLATSIPGSLEFLQQTNTAMRTTI